MLDHLQACTHCPKDGGGYSECTIYTDTSWVNRIGGCAMLPERDMPISHGRVGQQKQKHQDRSYTSKNDRKSKFRS